MQKYRSKCDVIGHVTFLYVFLLPGRGGGGGGNDYTARCSVRVISFIVNVTPCDFGHCQDAWMPVISVLTKKP